MDLLALLVAVAALVAGLGLGMFLGGRPAAQMRSERDAREAEFKAAAADLGRAQIELASLKAETSGMESRFAELAHRILGESPTSASPRRGRPTKRR